MSLADIHGENICIEVKGTSGPSFPNIEITAGEWVAAIALRDRYWLYLVANCLSHQPVL